eukprot:XP_011610735.1 PREDICTED: skin secretory protein xP2-like isoform X1 [Takifugu rubripes]
MFCRQAWKRAAPLARRVFKPAPRNGAPVRLLASGLPGGSFNTTYFVLCGGGLTAALVYAYKTINSDTERYESRLAGMGSTDKGQFEATPVAEPAPAEVAEVIPESVSAPPEEAAEVSADPVVSSEEAAAEAVSEEPAEAPGTAAEASGGAEGAAPPETPTAAHVGAGDLMAAVKLLAGSTVEIAAASVGDGSLVNVIRTTEQDSKGPSSLLEEIQPKLEEVTGNEDGDGGAAAANEQELKPAEEEEQESAPPPQETATDDAEPQGTGGAPDTDPSSDISPLDPAPAEKTMSDESPTPSEEALEATTPEEAALPEETMVTAPERSVEQGEDVSSAETSAEPEVLPAEDPKCTSEPPETPPLCHSVEETVPPAAQGEEALSKAATDETKSEESHSKSIHTIISTLAVVNGRLWL